VDGDCPGNLSLGQLTGDGSLVNLMQRRFWVGRGCFFLFTVACLQVITKGVLDPRLSWTDTCVVQVSTNRRPSPHIEDGEGFVAPRSTTDSTEKWV
jgi:hypothetical protein